MNETLNLSLANLTKLGTYSYHKVKAKVIYKNIINRTLKSLNNKTKAYFQSNLHSDCTNYRKVASSNTSHLEAHAGFFRLLMKGIFDPYMYCDHLTQKLIS